MRYWRNKYGISAALCAAVIILILLSIEEKKAVRTSRAIDTVQRLGGSVCRSDVCFEDGIPHGAFFPINPPGWPTRCAQALGADWLFDVVHVDFKDNKTGTPIADGDLAILAEFPNLLDLDLGGTEIGDEGLKHLARLRKLRNLDLRGTRVTDSGLVHLAELNDVKFINLDSTIVQGWGVDRLKRTVPGVNAGPIFESDLVDWRKLSDELDEFIKRRQSDTVRIPMKAGGK